MPGPTVRQPLPIDDLLPAVADALDQHRAAVLVAATGAGKTTRVPPALAGARDAGRIVMLEPRRIAARAAARRIADENGWRLGLEVGYQVRFERRWRAESRIVVVTEGTLVGMLQNDPLLDGIDTLIFDEFHERALDVDLALAMARRVQRDVRPDLRLLVMSATLDPSPVADFLGGCPVIHSAGRAHPVTIEHVGHEATGRLEDRVARGVRTAYGRCDGDLLVFLPGVGEIRRAQGRLERFARERDVDLVPLYGDLSGEQQDHALRAGARRKVVLATNVAETSVTVEGVDGVVDSGLARTLRFDPATGLDRLELGRISVASADQRAGRAGRLGPGHCLRLWSEHDHRSLPAFTAPAIKRVDLTGMVLQLMAWGERDPASFDFFEAPEAAALARAESLLAALGATGAAGVTARGQRMASLPLHPRLARLVLAGHEADVRARVARVAALLTERDIVDRPSRDRPAVAAYGTASDVLDRLRALERARDSGYAETALGPVRRDRVRHVERVARDIERAAERRLGRRPAVPGDARAGDSDTRLRRALLSAYPDRVARRRRPGQAQAVMVGGQGVELTPGSTVHDAELFVCVVLDDRRGGAHRAARVHTASAIERAWLADVDAESTAVEVRFDPDDERVVGQRVTRVGDLILDAVTCPVDAADAERILLDAAQAQPSRALDLEAPAVAELLMRARCLAAWMPELDLPTFDDAHIATLLPAMVAGQRSFAGLRRIPLAPILEGALSFAHHQALEREAPRLITVPSGSAIRLRYAEGEPPVLAVRIQEIFGLHETPRIAGGRVPVLLHLLAPNHRPQQITSDLASFWQRTYPEVRKELAGRYPKHAWPEDPLTATAERRPRRRRRR